MRLYNLIESFVRSHVGLPPTAWEWSYRANAALNRGELEAAIECATLAIARDKYFADGYVVRAMAISRQGDSAKAIEDWNQVVRLLPKWAIGWNERGRMNHLLGRLDAAIEDFNRAVSRDDRNPTMLANRGFAHAMAGNHVNAEKDWEWALKIDRNCLVVYQSRANYLHAVGRSAEQGDCAILGNLRQPGDSLCDGSGWSVS